MNKGGMGKNPFGGATRLDRIDFREFASGTDSPVKLLYLTVISDAASHFLFFGLAKNGTVPDDFWYASEYFFTCKSDCPETWEHARFMRHAYVDDKTGKRVSTVLMLTDDELKQGCFDKHYELAELDREMPIEQFREWLRIRREELLNENREQVNAYIDLLQQTALKEVFGGQQVPFKLTAADRFQVLARPESPEQIAELVYYAPRYMRTQCRKRFVSRTRRGPTISLPRPRAVMAQTGQIPFLLT